MNRSHIAIINELNPTHVHPTFSIVAALVRRGYRVTYVTLKQYASELASLGAEVVCSPPLDPTTPRSPLNKRYSGDLVHVASTTLSQVESFYRDNPPEMILHDTLSFAGAILAERLGIPAMRTSPQLAYDVDSFGHPAKPKSADHYRNWAAFWGKVDDFFRENGVLRSSARHKEPPTIFFYPKELQLPLADDDSHLYAARCAPERIIRGAWKSARAADRPAVLITASTIYEQGPEYYQRCMKAALNLGWHVVLAIGANNQVECFQPLPTHCEVIEGVPQALVMPAADLLIGMAGTATTTEAMYHGVPLLVITPGYAEAEMYAENVQKHGLGIHIEGVHATIEAVQQSILQIAEDETIRSKVKRMQAIVKRSPGAEDVANWIEDFLAV